MPFDRPRHNVVLLSLSLVGLLVWLALDTVSVAPNRIVPGTAHGLAASLGWAGALVSALPLLALAALARRPTPPALRLALGLTVLMLSALPLWLSLAAHRLVDPGATGARLGVGAGVWWLLFLLLMLLVELRSRLALSRLTGVVLLALPVAVLGLCLSRWLAPLALWQEYQGRRDQFLGAILEHLALVGAAVGVSLLLGLAAALAMRRWQAAQRIGFGALNVLQTIPSIALFGLLLAPLAWLSAHV
ncbi:MAG: ABC transporter permease, partial [Halomonas sp.]|nr:ABC transporter permease [Halomonas sp.]